MVHFSSLFRPFDASTLKKGWWGGGAREFVFFFFLARRLGTQRVPRLSSARNNLQRKFFSRASFRDLPEYVGQILIFSAVNFATAHH